MNLSISERGKRKLQTSTCFCVVDLRLLVLFHSWAPGCAPVEPQACCYHQGALSMRVSRKGHVVSGLEADWLELTAAYYRKGWSLVDSFVYWDTPKGNSSCLSRVFSAKTLLLQKIGKLFPALFLKTTISLTLPNLISCSRFCVCCPPPLFFSQINCLHPLSVCLWSVSFPNLVSLLPQ